MGVGEGVETQRLAWVTHTHEGKESNGIGRYSCRCTGWCVQVLCTIKGANDDVI